MTITSRHDSATRTRVRARVPQAAWMACVLAALGCSKEPTRWDQAAAAAKSATETRAADVPKTEGGSLNRMFPADGEGGMKRVFTQEKQGFAEAKLEKDGAVVATLAIADVGADQAARAKFAGVTENLQTWPLVTVGKNQSALLVKDKYQVKVSSTTLDPDGRKRILEKFDLAGLAKL